MEKAFSTIIYNKPYTFCHTYVYSNLKFCVERVHTYLSLAMVSTL